MHISSYGYILIDRDYHGRQPELIRDTMRKALGTKAYLVNVALDAKLYDWVDAMYCDQANWREVENPEFCEVYRGHRFYIEALGISIGQFFWLIRNGKVENLLKYPAFVAKLPTEIQEMVELGFAPRTITYEDGTTAIYHEDETEPVE